MSLDTHKLALDLQAASVTPEAATAIVEALRIAASDYATKDDLETQRVRIMSEISTAVAQSEARLVRELHTVVNRGVVMIILGLSAIGGAVTIITRIWGH